MNLSQIPYGFLFVYNIRLAAGMQERLPGGRVIDSLFGHAHSFEKLFYHPFHSIEIPFPVHTEGELHSLIRKLCEGELVGQIDIPQFVKPYVFVSSIIIGGKGSKHSIKGNGSHNGKVLSQRIGNHNRFPKG